MSRCSIPTILSFATLFSIVLPGCSVERTEVIRPNLDVEVVDEETGEAIEDAEVRVCRVKIGPPPDQKLDEWTATTDSAGRVEFEYRSDTEEVLPLLPHGTPQRAWPVCASAPGYSVESPTDYAFLETPGEETPERASERSRTILELNRETSDRPPETCRCDQY